MKGEEPQKDATPAASLKKQPPVQGTPAAVQPVKAAPVQVSAADVGHGIRRSASDTMNVLPESSRSWCMILKLGSDMMKL